MRRIFALLLLAAPASAQFYSLATPFDGSSVYFRSNLRLRGTFESAAGKIFEADERGVHLARGRVARTHPVNCTFGALYNFATVELSADATSTAAMGYRSGGGCAVFAWATLLSTPSGSREFAGYLRLSANGRYAIVDTTQSVYTYVSAQWLDLQTGARKDVSLPQTLGSVQFAAAGRTIADDGTAILSIANKAYLLRGGATLEPFPVANAGPIAISADGARVLYLNSDGAARILDLRTQQDRQIGPMAPLTPVGLSDAGSRAAFLQNRQIWVADFDGAAPRQATSEPDGIASAILSGNGNILYAATIGGRLVKTIVATGVTTEIIGRTPDVSTTGVPVDAGAAVQIAGSGFADESYVASAPLPLTLGGVSATLDGRPIPIAEVFPTSVLVVIPWDMGSSTPRTVVLNVASARTPFDSPEATMRVDSVPRAGPLFAENWSSLADLTVHPGEIIHIYATGLGAVDPEVAPGAAAPSTEPLARLAAPMTCANSEVLYAGLAPGTVQRQYFINLKIGPVTGYQQFTCAIGGGPAFAFLTLNVVP